VKSDLYVTRVQETAQLNPYTKQKKTKYKTFYYLRRPTYVYTHSVTHRMAIGCFIATDERTRRQHNVGRKTLKHGPTMSNAIHSYGIL